MWAAFRSVLDDVGFAYETAPLPEGVADSLAQVVAAAATTTASTDDDSGRDDWASPMVPILSHVAVVRGPRGDAIAVAYAGDRPPADEDDEGAVVEEDLPESSGGNELRAEGGSGRSEAAEADAQPGTGYNGATTTSVTTATAATTATTATGATATGATAAVSGDQALDNLLADVANGFGDDEGCADPSDDGWGAPPNALEPDGADDVFVPFDSDPTAWMQSSDSAFPQAVLYEAIYDYVGANQTNYLTLAAGEPFLYRGEVGNGWVMGTANGMTGMVPQSYVKPRGAPMPTDWQDEVYLDSYTDMKIHHEMLTDRVRTTTYQAAIAGTDLAGKVVLDVGAGSGVLSLMAARAGAARVYAVEGSDMAEHIVRVVAANGYESVITVINQKMENVALPEDVDVIVSEWMGTFLIFESMLQSVLVARDRFLKPGGALLPSSGRILLAPLSVPDWWEARVGAFDGWADVYGFNMGAYEELVVDSFATKPLLEAWTADNVIGDPCLVASFDIHTVTADDLVAFESPIAFDLPERGGAGETFMHGFVAWFDTAFDDRCGGDGDGDGDGDGNGGGSGGSVGSDGDESGGRVVLDCSPRLPKTHWKQVSFMLDAPVRLVPGDTVAGTLWCRQNPDFPRHYHVEIEFKAGSGDHPPTRKLWRIWQ